MALGALAAMLTQRVSTAQGAPPATLTAPFKVVLDAAHGGPDTGTIFSPGLLEKDLVLDVSVHLRSYLAARGMAVVTTRESDTGSNADTRAAIANAAAAAACIVLHATANGSGVHLYTSSLPQSTPAPGALVPWNAAQGPFATESLELASEIARAVTAAGVPYTLGSVRLPPLDSMRCPVVAVELAPLRGSRLRSDLGGGYIPIDNSGYRDRLVEALGSALVAWRAERERGGHER